jgi:hypothetical protein
METRRLRRAEYEDEDDWQSQIRKRLTGLGRATAASILLAILLLTELMAIAVDFLELQQLERGPAADARMVEMIDAAAAMVGLFRLGVQIAVIVVFLMWIYSAHANLRALGSREFYESLRFSPGWAVGYFFIPIVNLFRPIQVVQEIWRASDPNVQSEHPHAWKRAPGCVLAGFWWAFWLVGNMLGNASFQASLATADNVNRFKTSLVLGIVGDLFSIVAGIFVILVILAIKQRQIQKYEGLTGTRLELEASRHFC